MSLRENALKAMSGEDTSVRGGVLRTLLTAAAPVYALGQAARSASFATGLKRTFALGLPTISVGNLTTGGTGKTPMVAWLADYLIELGAFPCVLLRGYRGGDEAQEHKERLGDAAHVEPDPDRVAAAKRMLNADPPPTCFLLDDGFQHRRAQRDLDLVLIDATNPWGYGSMLPRGLMREPKSALRRADAVIVTRADRVDEDRRAQLDREIETITGKPPLAHAMHTWVGLIDAQDNAHPLSTIADKRVMGVIGLGNPAAFTDTLKQHAGEVMHCEQYPDHHRYTRKLLLQLIDLAESAGAQAVVTSEKDWVKWAVLLEDETVNLPIYRVDLQMRFLDGEAALKGLLQSSVAGSKAAGDPAAAS